MSDTRELEKKIERLERKIEELTTVVHQNWQGLLHLETFVAVSTAVFGFALMVALALVVPASAVTAWMGEFWGSVIGLVLLAIETASTWIPVLLTFAFLFALLAFLERHPKKKAPHCAQ